MAIISTKAELIERLKDIEAVEIKARLGYMQDTVTFRNFQLINTIKSIKEDEDKHIRLISELIAYLKRNN